MRKERLERFMAGFNTVSLKLKEMYQMITLGGDAELELVDSLDPFSEVLQPQTLSPVLHACHCLPGPALVGQRRLSLPAPAHCLSRRCQEPFPCALAC